MVGPTLTNHDSIKIDKANSIACKKLVFEKDSSQKENECSTEGGLSSGLEKETISWKREGALN